MDLLSTAKVVTMSRATTAIEKIAKALQVESHHKKKKKEKAKDYPAKDKDN